MKELWKMTVTQEQHEKYKSGALIDEWLEGYPQLFDKEDNRLIKSQGPMGYHFYECLAAITIYNCFGYKSLIEKYELNKSHQKKYQIFKSLVPSKLHDYIMNPNKIGTQPPDLFCYEEKEGDWFFCEVKGKGDRLSVEQKIYFEKIEEISNKEILLININKKKAII